MVALHEQRHAGEPWNNFLEQLQPLSRQLVEKSVTPVMLPPGRAKLATSLLPIGSEIAVMTTGVVLFRSRIARIASVLFEAITSTLSASSSLARAASRSVRPSANRYAWH